MSPVARETASAANDKPWWKHGMVWLVLGGPLVVVAALVDAVRELSPGYHAP